MEIKGHRWFTGRDCIGLVIVGDDKGNDVAYIGVGDGLDEAADVKKIRDWGTSFPIDAAKLLIEI